MGRSWVRQLSRELRVRAAATAHTGGMLCACRYTRPLCRKGSIGKDEKTARRHLSAFIDLLTPPGDSTSVSFIHLR
jgi:hypothetical protein